MGSIAKAETDASVKLVLLRPVIGIFVKNDGIIHRRRDREIIENRDRYLTGKKHITPPAFIGPLFIIVSEGHPQ
jgi:hypothetical protein